jgi:hypothetical protein
MTMPGVAVRMSRTPLRIGAPVRPPGDDAPAVLASVGMADQLDALLQAGAIVMTHVPESLTKKSASLQSISLPR